MIAQPAGMSHLIMEQEQRLPGTTFDDVELDTSGLHQLLSPRYRSCRHDAAPTFHLCGKGSPPCCLKGRGRKSQAIHQRLDGRHPTMDIPMMSKVSGLRWGFDSGRLFNVRGCAV